MKGPIILLRAADVDSGDVVAVVVDTEEEVVLLTESEGGGFINVLPEPLSESSNCIGNDPFDSLGALIGFPLGWYETTK